MFTDAYVPLDDAGGGGGARGGAMVGRRVLVGHVAEGPQQGPWRIKVGAAGAATFTECLFQTQMVVREPSNLTAGALSGTVGTTGTCYVGVEIDGESFAAEIITGTTLAEVSYAAKPSAEQQAVCRIPLYRLENGRVSARYCHGIPQTGWYM